MYQISQTQMTVQPNSPMIPLDDLLEKISQMMCAEVLELYKTHPCNLLSTRLTTANGESPQFFTISMIKPIPFYQLRPVDADRTYITMMEFSDDQIESIMRDDSGSFVNKFDKYTFVHILVTKRESFLMIKFLEYLVKCEAKYHITNLLTGEDTDFRNDICTLLSSLSI